MGSDEIDEQGWQEGDPMSWSYLIEGSAVIGASQLAQARGPGCYPGQLISAPLGAVLRRRGVPNTISEYYLQPLQRIHKLSSMCWRNRIEKRGQRDSNLQLGVD